ncbi:MAG: ribosome silencing factor [Pseudomonadota bacterium]|jgi:ribosome-associated protein
MDIKKLQALVIDALEDVKAQDIKIYDTTHLTSMFDSIVVASGTSNRQTKALAASVRDKVKAAGGEIVSMEGENTGEWVLVDLGDMVVHIMQPAIRAYYRLEELWGDKEIRLADIKGGKEARKSGSRKSVNTTAATTSVNKPVKKVAKKSTKTKLAAADQPPAARKSTASSKRSTKTTTKATPAKASHKAAAKPGVATMGKSSSKPTAKPTAKPAVKSAAKKAVKKAVPKRAAVKG